MAISSVEYLLLKLAFTDFGRLTLNEFIQEVRNNNDTVKQESTKDLSKQYVDDVKGFLGEMNKDTPDKQELLSWIARLSCHHYKLYMSIRNS